MPVRVTKRQTAWLHSFVLVFLFLFLWAIYSHIFPNTRFPSPRETAIAWLILLKGGELGFHVGYTLFRLYGGLLPAVLLGSLMGIGMYRLPVVDNLFRPVLLFFSTIPKTALFPLIILLFGLNDTARIVCVGLVIFFQAWIAVRDEIAQLDSRYHPAITACGGKGMDLWRFVYVPGLLSRIFTILRIGTAGAYAVLFFTETSLYRGYGMGRLIASTWMNLDYPAMMAVVLTGALTGWCLFYALELLEYAVLPWRRSRVPSRRFTPRADEMFYQKQQG